MLKNESLSGWTEEAEPTDELAAWPEKGRKTRG